MNAINSNIITYKKANLALSEVEWANSNPIKPKTEPIAKKPEMNVNAYYTKEYNKKTHFPRKQSKPKQTQNKPNLRNAQNELKIACQNLNSHYNNTDK